MNCVVCSEETEGYLNPGIPYCMKCFEKSLECNNRSCIETRAEVEKLRAAVEWALGIIETEDSFYAYWSKIADELRRRAK